MTSMQEYLKRYTSDADKKKKKKKKSKSKGLNGGALTIVDADPVWQKDFKEDSSESEAEKEDAPLIIEDVEFKRMQRLEALRMRPYHATAADGSGWVLLNDDQSQGPMAEGGMDADLSSSPRERQSGASPQRKETDLSPPRREEDLSPPRKGRHDLPEIHLPSQSSSPPQKDSRRGHHDSPESGPQSQDLSPPRKALKRNNQDFPNSSAPSQQLSPSRRAWLRGRQDSPELNTPRRDLSPPRRESRRGRHDSPDFNTANRDLSPPRREARRGRHDSPALKTSGDMSPPRRESKRGRHNSPQPDLVGIGTAMDLSPPRKDSRSSRSSDIRNVVRNKDKDLPPPRRHGRHDSPESVSLQLGKSLDLSPPRRERKHAGKDDTGLSPTRRTNRDSFGARDVPKPKRGETMGDGTAAGLQSGRELAKEITMKKKSESKRVKDLDTTISGRNATTVYRDKQGRRLEGVEEILKLQQAEEPKKEDKPLEWGKGLVQKREAEAHQANLEAERLKPFARTREDLDEILKQQIRWGDPMAHLVKKKGAEPVLADLGANELMKESGFIIPQEIPAHSWLKRGVAPPPNRYGIRPGRHWDGVDRSTGYERDMYKRQNEKKAEQEEAYLWSVADM